MGDGLEVGVPRLAVHRAARYGQERGACADGRAGGGRESWEALCKKYLIDVMGGANLETETQKKIGALFSEMKAAADKKELKQAQEEAALYREQIARLEAESAQYREAQSAKKDEVRKATKLAIELEAFLQ